MNGTPTRLEYDWFPERHPRQRPRRVRRLSRHRLQLRLFSSELEPGLELGEASAMTGQPSWWAREDA